MKKLIAITILSIYIGCTPKPTYVIEKRFIEPISQDGKLCIYKCSIEKRKCIDIVNKKYDRCIADSSKKAEAQIDIEMDKYYNLKAEYIDKLEVYNNLMESWSNKMDDLKGEMAREKRECNEDIDRYLQVLRCSHFEKIYKETCKDIDHKSKKYRNIHIAQNSKKDINRKLSCMKHSKIYKIRCDRKKIYLRLPSCGDLDKIKEKISDLREKKPNKPELPIRPTLNGLKNHVSRYLFKR